MLVCHGAADPLVPPADVAAFEEAMGRTKVDWQLHAYGGAVHAFTNPEAGTAGNRRSAYNEAADRRRGPPCSACCRKLSLGPHAPPARERLGEGYDGFRTPSPNLSPSGEKSMTRHWSGAPQL